MANKQQQLLLLHELLKEDQEPFHLNSFISHKRSQFKQTSHSTIALQLKKRRQIISESTLKPGRHACFLSFMNSPDVRKSPFLDFQSPASMSPCKSPNGAVFLHIPSKTAAHLAEAAMRIQKQRKIPGRSVGFGLLGSFLKRLKDLSKSKKRVIGVKDFKVSRKQGKVEENVRIRDAVELVDLDQASTSSCYSEELNCDIELGETRFCVSPFRFSLHQSPLSTGRCTPDFCSPMASPSHVVKQVKENVEIQDSDNNVQGEREEEKEQCSPVSVLDPPFEDDEQESGDAEDGSYDPECGYANVQRTKEQLLYRLRRFEKLAELDPIELQRKLLEGSDSEDEQEELEESKNDEPLLYTNYSIHKIVTKYFNESTVQNHSMKRSSDMNDEICLGNKEVILDRVCKRLDFSKEVKFETIDMMIELDFNSDFDGWKSFSEQGEETMAEIELAIFGLLVDELSEEQP